MRQHMPGDALRQFTLDDEDLFGFEQRCFFLVVAAHHLLDTGASVSATSTTLRTPSVSSVSITAITA